MRFFLFFFSLFPLLGYGFSELEKSCLWEIKYEFPFPDIQKHCETLSNGALDFFDSEGFSPLIYAIRNKDRAVVQFLLQKGANPFMRNIHWIDSMQSAALFGASDIIPVLKQSGVSTNSEDDESNTPLMMASERGFLDTAKLLISLGANVHHRNKWNQSALLLATIEGHFPIVKLLSHYGAKSHYFSYIDGRTPLHEASISDQVEILRFFLQKGEDPNIQSLYTGMTPLAYSVLFGAKESFDYLLTLKKVKIDLWNFKHQTPLYLAVQMGREEMVRALLIRGAKVDLPSQGEVTPLDLAKNKGANKILKILMEFVKS